MFNSYRLAHPTLFRSLPYHHLFKPLILHSMRGNNVFYSTSIDTKLVTSLKKINVRTMTKQDLQGVIGWAAQEGWDPGLYEVGALHAADPTGYRLLEINNEPVASLGCIRYSKQFAFLGLYIVKPSHRGQGYGKLLWDITMGYLKDCDTIGLNAVYEQIGKYQKEGFNVAHRNPRWRGSPLKLNLNSIAISPKIQQPASLVPLIDYDARLFPAPRVNFLTEWLTMPNSHVLTAIENNKPRGYGVISKTTEGYKIAPLMADNAEIAKNLYAALCRYAGDKNLVYIDTPENNPEAIRLMQQFGLENSYTTYRMYKGEIRPLCDNASERPSNVFGITSIEIGFI